MTFNPKISVIVPLYNCENYITECIDSIFNQTYQNIEVFCIDNESTDKSYDIIKKLKEEKYSKLIIDTAPNIYPLCWDEARELAFSMMTGEYCLTIASDDYLEKDFIKKNVDIFSKSPKQILALQSGILGVQNGKTTNTQIHSYKNLNEYKSLLLQKCVVNSPTVIYNRELYDKGWLKTKPEEYSGAADYDLYCSLADKGIMIYAYPEWLGYYYRWHDKQATWEMHKSNVNYDKKIQTYWKDKWI